MAARDSFQKRINDGTCKWYGFFGKGKRFAVAFSDCARFAWYNGHVSLPSACIRMIENIPNEIALQLLSTETSMRKIQLSRDSAQPSGVPATSTSPLNKGKSRQESSLSEESPLNEQPSNKSLDTAKSSQPSTSGSLESSCLPNEPLLQPSSSLQVPPLYSEAVNDGDISINLEDDKEDDWNDMAPEEVGAWYKLWRQFPEEKNPWESTASLLRLEKLRAQGTVIT